MFKTLKIRKVTGAALAVAFCLTIAPASQALPALPALDAAASSWPGLERVKEMAQDLWSRLLGDAVEAEEATTTTLTLTKANAATDDGTLLPDPGDGLDGTRVVLEPHGRNFD